MAKELNSPKKSYVAVKSLFARFSVQVESALGTQRCSGRFCSSNSQMNKELTNCQRPMEHRLNMSRLLTLTCLDPLTLGWRYLDQKLVPVFSHLISPPPVSVLQLVRCNCEKSKCSRRCSCGGSGNNWLCTELCKCGRECDNYANITQPMIDEDLDD